MTETDLIIGYSEAALDVIDLVSGATVLDDEVVGGNLQLTLSGGDADIIVVQGITNINDVTII